jgi:hypothetical protein
VRCTDEVVHRVKRIPIPFVRQMVIQKVVDAARRNGVTRRRAILRTSGDVLTV